VLKCTHKAQISIIIFLDRSANSRTQHWRRSRFDILASAVNNQRKISSVILFESQNFFLEMSSVDDNADRNVASRNIHANVVAVLGKYRRNRH